jgi:hypothetical protein
MNPSQIRREISDFVASLLENGLAVDTNSTVLRRQGRWAYVVWSSAPKDSLRFPVPPGLFATAAEYRMLLEARQYNCLLSDGAYFQMSYEFRHNDLKKHRLCYYPCPVRLSLADLPFTYSVGDLVDDQMIHVLEALEWLGYTGDSSLTDDHEEPEQDSEELPKLQLRSPIRFDFDPDAQTPGHPASHVHVSNGGCRIPVYAPLSLGHFVRFIFRHFYPAAWQEHEFLRSWPLGTQGRTIIEPEEAELFFECREAATCTE